MGFKMRSCYVLGGSEEFPIGNTYELQISRSKVLLSKCAQCLIDCGCGWQLDPTKSTSITDYTNIPSIGNSPRYMPGLFFTNTISGCKLFMSYFGYDCGAFSIRNFNSTNLLPTQITRHSGLCISMIPGGSESVFGDPSIDSTFIPSDATRICGTFFYDTSGSASKGCAAYNPVSGMYYKYYIFATSSVVAVGMINYNSIPGRPNVPIYATGELFGTLANSADTAVNSKFATLMFRLRSNSYDGDGVVITNGMSAFVGGGNYTYVAGYNNEGTGSNIGAVMCTAAVSKSDGSWLNGQNSYSPRRTVIHYTAHPYALNVNASWSSIAAWSPIAVASVSGDLATYGVVPGNGFKGFLDTDLFRCAGDGTHGTTYDNNKFYYCETNKYLVIGWDPSNNS